LFWCVGPGPKRHDVPGEVPGLCIGEATGLGGTF
jgi:hypothetical protein